MTRRHWASTSNRAWQRWSTGRDRFELQLLGHKLHHPDWVNRTVARHVLKRNGIKRVWSSMGTENGALEIDGEDTPLASESSLLKINCNSCRTKTGMEETFCELLGVKKTIWLEGVEGLDRTDQHVDLLARFRPNASTVVLSLPHDTIFKTNPRHAAYAQARFVLGTSTNVDSNLFSIVEIEEAARVPRADEEGPDIGHASTSYANFNLANGAFIVPQFGECGTDEAAVKTMQELLPDRSIEAAMLNRMPWAGGGPHSATM